MNQTIRERLLGSTTQTQIAAKLGCCPQTVSLWFKTKVPAERVLGLCDALDFSITPHQVRPDIYPNPGDALPVNNDSGNK